MSAKYGQHVLLVEDTPSMAMLYRKQLEKGGYSVETVGTLADGFAALEKGRFHAVLLDMMLPDGNGIDLLESPLVAKAPIIVITADGSINMAVKAVRSGAFDFLVKPFKEDALLRVVGQASSSFRPTLERDSAAPDVRKIDGFVGSSAVMMSLYDRVVQVARSNATVFITGESGTGKEVCAQAIHAMSERAGYPFIALNCGAIPSELLESEVFGHLKGSFTGAIADKIGAARAANGGVLFLDEVCEMDLALQTKLLRFLQSSTVTPVGATMPEPVNVRIICATNRDPAAEVRAGRFREDLFFRLHVVPVHLPPLRERGLDIMELAHFFLEKFSLSEGKYFTGIDAEATAKLMAMRWPGNVRQLENLMRMLTAVHDGPIVTAAMLPPEVETSIQHPLSPQEKPLWRRTDDAPIISESVDLTSIEARIAPLVGEELVVVERVLIEMTISACNGSVPKAARKLGVSPSTIYRKRESWSSGAA